MNLELVEFQSRKTAVPPARITHIGVGYSRMQVPNLDVALPQVLAAGANAGVQARHHDHAQRYLRGQE